MRNQTLVLSHQDTECDLQYDGQQDGQFGGGAKGNFAFGEGSEEPYSI